MKIRTDLFLFAILLLFAACTAARRTAVPLSAIPEPDAPAVIPPPPSEYTPAQMATYYYLQGIRLSSIYSDFSAAAACFETALEYDSLHAPSYFELSNLQVPIDTKEALRYSRTANELEPGNIWFKQQLGRLYIMEGQYDEARKVYDEIVRLAPENPDNFRYLAALYEETGFPYAALALLDSAEVRFGFIEELASYRRQLLVQTGMIDRAITESKTMTLNSPYDGQNFVILGDLYARSGKDSLALDAYNQALAIAPGDVDALMSLSDFYRTRNDGAGFLSASKRLFASDDLPLENKITFFNDIVKNPQFYQQHYYAVDELVTALAIKYAGQYKVTQLYAEHRINSGDIEGALATYKSALTDTSGMAAYKTVIDIEAYLERNDSVSHYTDLALERFPGEVELYFTKGFAEYYMKEYAQSVRTLSEGLRYASDDSLKSVIYSSMGQIDKDRDSLSGDFVKYFRRALKYDPENLHAVYNYSDYLVNSGKDPEKALKRIKSDSIRSLMLGTIGDLVHQKDTVTGRTDSFRYYEKALRHDPDNIHALNNYSYYLSLLDRELEKALEMIARVMELEPGNPTYIDTYGWILYKLGRYEEAKLALRQAVALDKEGSRELLIHYGDILYELNDYFMASIYWKKALEKGYDPAEIEVRLHKIDGK